MSELLSIDIPPIWRIVPGPLPMRTDREQQILFESGRGWGTGAHETTQLCLQALAYYARQKSHREFRMLDFGSGSGLLSIAAAKLGGIIDAVEIDDSAIEHSKQNADANHVRDRIRFANAIAECSVAPTYDIIVANVFNIILMELASDMVSTLKENGSLVLSGIVATDVPVIATRYSSLLGGRKPQVFHRGEWRALVWM